MILSLCFGLHAGIAESAAVRDDSLNDAQLILVHVLEIWRQPKEGNRKGLTVAEAMRQLHEIGPPEAGLWCRPEAVVEHVEPAERILEIANQEVQI